MTQAAIIDYKETFHQSGLSRLIIEKREDHFYVLDANDVALKYFHANACELKGEPVDRFLDVANTAHILQALSVCYTSKVSISIQILPNILGHIQVQSFILEPIRNNDGSMRYISMQARPPTTDQAAIERERDDAISMFTTVFDVSEVGITVTDHHGRFVRINDAFIQQTGWEAIDLIGHEMTRIIPKNHHELAWERHNAAFKEKRKNFGEITILRKDGTPLSAMVTSVIMELSNGRSFRISTVIDITELKQIEHDLRKAKDEADEANKAKSAFLANMSHELRTPLNAIIGFSEMMINGTLGKIENDHYVEYLDDIKFSAQHLLQIINDVLDMSKIEAGKMPLDEEFINIAGLVDSVCRLMAARAQQENLDVLQQHSTPDLPYLLGDERLVRQVFLNILSNAIKFSAHGNSITVKITHETGKKGGLFVEFTDQGIGIPAERLPDIMEPFGQIADPRVNKGQGTGLGLPIARAMMEMHGGELAIASVPNKGTTVTCYFPQSRVKNKR